MVNDMDATCFNCKHWKKQKQKVDRSGTPVLRIGKCDVVMSRRKSKPDGSVSCETYGNTTCRWYERKAMLKFGKPRVTAAEAMNEIAKICKDAYNNMEDKEDFNSPAEKFGYEAWKYLMQNGVFISSDEQEGQQKL